MNYINAIIFGIAQGATEFLPVSSSGHLVILHKIIKLPIANELMFDVTLHLASVLAVILFFRYDIKELLKSWVKSFSQKADETGRLSWLIILATIPAALAGFFLGDFIEFVFRSQIVVAVMLIFVGALFIIFERVSRQAGGLTDLNWRKSLVIGLSQAVALIPGTSRSGITIIAGLGMGLKREAALKFSFLLSIPIILGASLKKIPDSFGASYANDELIVLIIAFMISFLISILTIKYFLRFAKNSSLNIFAYYRFALAILIIVIMFF